jgi:hypothetical protein
MGGGPVDGAPAIDGAGEATLRVQGGRQAVHGVSGKGGVEGELTASILERAGEVARVKAGLEAVAESNGNTGHDGGVDGDREGPKEAVRGALEVSWGRIR